MSTATLAPTPAFTRPQQQDGRATVVIGYLGTQLDNGQRLDRWQKWRPTVGLMQQDVVIDRLELFYAPGHERLLETVLADIAQVSPATQVNPVPMPLRDPWDFGEVYASLYDWASRQSFDTERERYWVHITTGTHVAQICLFLMVEARFIPGLLLQTSPRPGPGAALMPAAQAVDQASGAVTTTALAASGETSTTGSAGNRARSIGHYTLIDLDLSRYDELAQRFDHARQQAQVYLKNGIATRNPRFNRLIAEIEQVAVRSKAPILLTGPTGAGKSHLARRLFELKKNRHQVTGNFIEVNCATLRGDTASSTLFGHKRGAFTGAAGERAGLLRSAHQGVLFLDEIGELGLDEQAMLLKAVEERRFLPMGSDHEVHSDFQLIAGTNRDLRHEVAAGRFREDLFARINLWSWHLPGLAERPEDIEPNVDHLLARMPDDGGKLARFSTEARQRYLAFAQGAEAPWRGNFRDLAASITRLTTLADGGRITVEQVDAEIARLRWLWALPAVASRPFPALSAGADAASPAQHLPEESGSHRPAPAPTITSGTSAQEARNAAHDRPIAEGDAARLSGPVTLAHGHPSPVSATTSSPPRSSSPTSSATSSPPTSSPTSSSPTESGDSPTSQMTGLPSAPGNADDEPTSGGASPDPVAKRPALLARLLPADTLAGLDLFDRLQLEAVIATCRHSRTLAEAGRTLFDQSRTQRSAVNDTDRLRKYLLKFGLNWRDIQALDQQRLPEHGSLAPPA